MFDSTTKISYIWDSVSSTYAQLSNIATDLLFYTDLSSLPSVGDTISLYVTQNNNYIYKWNSDNLSYEYFKSVTSEALMLLEGTYCKYSCPSIPPKNISIDKVYRIFSDNGKTYIVNDKKEKLYLDINMIMIYFIPSSGISWSELLGHAQIPEPIDYSGVSNVNEIAILNSLKEILDVNNNNYIDYSEDSGKLNGKTGSYYLSEIAKKANQTSLDTTNTTVSQKADKTYVDGLASTLSTKTENNLKTNKSGDTMTGDLNMDNESAILFGGRFRISRNKSLDSLDFDLI
jgi:hypothetical protein